MYIYVSIVHVSIQKKKIDCEETEFEEYKKWVFFVCESTAQRRRKILYTFLFSLSLSHLHTHNVRHGIYIFITLGMKKKSHKKKVSHNSVKNNIFVPYLEPYFSGKEIY